MPSSQPKVRRIIPVSLLKVNIRIGYGDRGQVIRPSVVIVVHATPVVLLLYQLLQLVPVLLEAV